MKQHLTTKIACAVLAASAAIPVEVAHAQSADTMQVEEVIVTAQRREENLEKVPLSVLALSADALRERGIVNEADLQSAVPGLVVRESVGDNNYTFIVRGQTVDAYSSSPPAVLVYYDDVNIAPHAQSSFFDLSSVQVLKGPQGTLFGRNTTGGAVLYQTTQPGEKFGGYVTAQQGSYDSTTVQAAINLPFDPKVLIRIAGNYNRNDGYVYNLATKDWWGRTSASALRGTIVLKPTDQLTNTTMVQYDKRNGISVPNELSSVYKCGTPGLNTTIDCITNGAAYAELLAQKKRGPYVSNLSAREAYSGLSYLAVNTTKYEVNADTTIKNIVGMGRNWSNGPYDYDATPFTILENTPRGETMVSTNYSEELQALGSTLGGQLKYTAGFYYSHEKDIINAPLTFGGFLFGYNTNSTERTIAGYLQASYQLTDQVGLTGGIRYTGDRVTLTQLAESVYGPGHPETMSVSKPSWNVSAEYQTTPDIMLYVTTRGSYRSGGFNFADNPVPQTAASAGNLFYPEQLKDIEGGVKSSGRLGDVPFRFNLDVYNSWIDNSQRVAYVIVGGAPVALTVNLKSAQITGADSDFEFKLAPWLNVGGTLAYTHARFTQPIVTLFGSVQNFGPFADAPGWSGSAYAELSHDLAENAGRLTLRTDVYAQSKYYFSNLNNTTNPDAIIAGFGLVNLKVSWLEIFGSHLSASLAVNNLFDKHYYVGGLQEGSDLGVNSQVPGRPRWVTGELHYEF
ncbi:MAG: hypothetical protein EPO08_06015 [Rhodospirillaceae bacterium]|nr:MAG: hypothetical protein EPO08_06015 [Rhodospirillaceae bacterium]